VKISNNGTFFSFPDIKYNGRVKGYSSELEITGK
jgi:hypothetical protein